VTEFFNSLDSRHIHKPNVRKNPFRELTTDSTHSKKHTAL